MPPLLLGLMLFGADVGVFVEVREDVSVAESLAIADAMTAAVARELGWSARLATPEWVSCSEHAACLREVKAATGGEQVLMLKMFGTSTRVRVVAQRFHLSDAAIASAELDLLRGEDASSAAAVAARALFPGISRGSGEIAMADRTGDRSDRSRWLPWTVIGASAVLGGVGVGLGASSASLRRELETTAFSGDEYLDRRSALEARATAANLCVGGALLGGVVGLVLFLVGV